MTLLQGILGCNLGRSGLGLLNGRKASSTLVTMKESKTNPWSNRPRGIVAFSWFNVQCLCWLRHQLMVEASMI